MNEDRQLLGPLSVSILKGQAVGRTAPAGSVNWYADRWFTEDHAADLNKEFKTWWVAFYGCPEDYPDYEDEQHEYWVRCAFALGGWLAARQPEQPNILADLVAALENICTEEEDGKWLVGKNGDSDVTDIVAKPITEAKAFLSSGVSMNSEEVEHPDGIWRTK